MAEKIGSVNKIMRFPVKSMKGHEVDEVFVSFSGLTGDRIYAFVDKSKQNNFPWMTARQRKDMILYKTELVTPPNPRLHYPRNQEFDVNVETPEGKKCNIVDEELVKELEQKTNKELELRFSEAGMQDSRPVSILSFQSLVKLGKELDMKIDFRRFRMNLNVDWDNNKSFYEEGLLGKKIRIGEKLLLEITKKDARCPLITLDPETGEQKLELLKRIVKQHGGCFGVYAVVIREGIVKTGDSIFLE